VPLILHINCVVFEHFRSQISGTVSIVGDEKPQKPKPHRPDTTPADMKPFPKGDEKFKEHYDL